MDPEFDILERIVWLARLDPILFAVTSAAVLVVWRTVEFWRSGPSAAPDDDDLEDDPDD